MLKSSWTATSVATLLTASLAPRRLLIGLGLLAILSIGVLLGLDAYREHKRDQAVLEEQLTAAAELLAEHAQLSFAAADVILAEVEADIRQGGLEAFASEESSWDSLYRTPQFSSLAVFDATGNMRFWTLASPAGAPDSAPHEAFEAHRRGLSRHIGEPVSDRISGKRLLPVSMRLGDGRGTFLGIAVVYLDVAYFEAFYIQVRDKLDVRIGMSRRDGTVLALYPDVPAMLSARAQEDIKKLFERGESASYVGASSLDGRKRIGAYRHVDGYPLTATVSYEYQAFLTKAYPGFLRNAIIFVAFAAAIAPSVVLISRAMRASEKARESRLQSEARYRSLFEHSLDGILLLGPEHRIVSANSAACAILGRSQEELITGSPSRIIGLNDPAFRHAFAEQARTGRFRGELWVWRAGSILLPIDVSASEFQEPDGCRYISVIFRDISERKRHQHELETSREEIHRLWAFVQSVREAEQKRFARELHDELGQLITALKLDLSWLRRHLPAGDAFLEDKVTDLEVLVEASLDAQRRLLSGLRPRALDEAGLSAACQWLLQEFERSSGIAYQLCLSHSEFQLSEEMATALFRIVQEALTNIARHAHASLVRVSLLQQQESFTVRIVDNGRGFTTGPPLGRRSFGLLGMRERVHLLNGELAIDSSPGQGTEILVTLPLAVTVTSVPPEPVAIDEICR